MAWLNYRVVEPLGKMKISVQFDVACPESAWHTCCCCDEDAPLTSSAGSALKCLHGCRSREGKAPSLMRASIANWSIARNMQSVVLPNT